MKYLLDTNICIYWFKGLKEIDKKISSIDVNDISVSAITIAELLFGAYNSTKVEKNMSKIKEFEEVINVIGLDRKCVGVYAQKKVILKTEGKLIDDFDILIAATAITNNCILVTNNEKHFARIDGLITENWIKQIK